MTKVVINSCFGGFSLSEDAYIFMGLTWDNYGYEFNDHEQRTDETLVACVETLGAAANGRCAQLTVVEIPDGVNYIIEDYDGVESIHETHRVWR